MKQALLGLVQFVLFVLVFLAGSLLNPGGLHWFTSHPTATSTRDFSPGGLIAVTLLFVLILLAEAAAKRLRAFGTGTVAAYVLTLLAGFLAHFGFATHGY